MIAIGLVLNRDKNLSAIYMKKEIVLQKSSKKDKKFDVKLNNKTISFGAKGMSDYTKHKDPERKQRYLNRRSDKEKRVWNDIETPAYWAKNLLWNKPSLNASIKDIEKRKNVDIKYKK